MTLLESVDELLVQAEHPHELWDKLESPKLHFDLYLNDQKQQKKVISKLTKLGMTLCANDYNHEGTERLTFSCTKEQLIEFKNLLEKVL